MSGPSLSCRSDGQDLPFSPPSCLKSFLTGADIEAQAAAANSTGNARPYFVSSSLTRAIESTVGSICLRLSSAIKVVKTCKSFGISYSKLIVSRRNATTSSSLLDGAVAKRARMAVEINQSERVARGEYNSTFRPDHDKPCSVATSSIMLSYVSESAGP